MFVDRAEFGRHLLWSRVDVNAALRVHVCEWESQGSLQHKGYTGAASIYLGWRYCIPVAPYI